MAAKRSVTGGTSGGKKLQSAVIFLFEYSETIGFAKKRILFKELTIDD